MGRKVDKSEINKNNTINDIDIN